MGPALADLPLIDSRYILVPLFPSLDRSRQSRTYPVLDLIHLCYFHYFSSRRIRSDRTCIITEVSVIHEVVVPFVPCKTLARMIALIIWHPVNAVLDVPRE